MQGVNSRFRMVLGSVAFALGCALAAQAQDKAPSKDLVLTGDAKCTRCHDESEAYPVLAIGKTKHGVTADNRTPTCTSCHGQSENHINKPADAKERPKPDRTFGKGSPTPPEVRAEACLQCHQGAKRMYWVGSIHDRARTVCSDCHNVHAPRDQVLVTQTQAGVCFTCHKEKRSAILRFSVHPLRTGYMTCSACHNPHGSVGEHNLAKQTVNETCYVCHADKRGPLLWEHPPVKEDCTLCHDPHGTNNKPMLKARMPYLCQQCHVNPFHPSTLYSGRQLPGGQPGNIDMSRMVGQSCANCHTKVHGSNHPSGARFTR